MTILGDVACDLLFSEPRGELGFEDAAQAVGFGVAMVSRGVPPHIADFHAGRAIIESAAAGETIVRRAARLRCQDGATKPGLAGSNVLRHDGKSVHTRCFTRDVTELKLAAVALRARPQSARDQETSRRDPKLLEQARDTIDRP